MNLYGNSVIIITNNDPDTVIINEDHEGELISNNNILKETIQLNKNNEIININHSLIPEDYNIYFQKIRKNDSIFNGQCDIYISNLSFETLKKYKKIIKPKIENNISILYNYR